VSSGAIARACEIEGRKRIDGAGNANNSVYRCICLRSEDVGRWNKAIWLGMLGDSESRSGDCNGNDLIRDTIIGRISA